MSEDGDKTCPLCAEEMDITDQQLKPCKCGYEICVWCWHQIMDMAEKSNSEGRCPACRTLYDKERIVGMAANCERFATEISTEKKYKAQNTKLKMSADARKNLSRVRVVQRNLVYIMGLPSHLADESVLERKEYFGQYGKILKVSISRPTTTAQQASSNCFSVYITYASEEDAILCIQSVHNYTLEGKALRACFGTTKYCHSWLKNMTCSNPDCLYLHVIGCQEDSFMKDEMISAYSRSRVPQVALNNLQRRAGNILPPPTDDLGTNRTTSSKTFLRMPSNNTVNHIKSVNAWGEKSTALPAAASCGSQVPNNSQNPVKLKQDIFNSSTQFHSSKSSIKCISAWNDHAVASSKEPKPDPDNRAENGGSRISEALKLVSPNPVVSTDLPDITVDAENSLVISSWDDDNSTGALEGRNLMHVDSLSMRQKPPNSNSTMDETISVFCNSTEIGFNEACNYAWDDGIGTKSNQVTDKNFPHIDEKTCLPEALICCSDQDYQTSLSQDTTAGDTTCISGISCGFSQLLDVLNLDREGLGADEVATFDTIKAKALESNDSLSKRVDCDDVVSSNFAYKKDIDCFELSAIKFDSHLVADHQNKETFQVLSPNICSNFTSGCSAIKFCQNNLNKEAERLSSVTSSHGSVAADSQFYPIKLPDWTSNRQTDVLLATPNGENYSLANEGQREKLLNFSIQTPLSSYSLDQPEISYFPSYNLHKEDACHSHNLPVADSFSMGAVIDQELFTLKNHDTVLPVEPMQDRQYGFSMQRGIHEASSMRFTENESSYLGKTDDLATLKTMNINTGEKSIISNELSLDFDPWEDSFQSAESFTKFLREMDKKGGSLSLPNFWKLQNNNQSRFSFARQETSTKVSANSLAASQVEKLNSSAQELFRGTLQSKIPAPPDFSLPNRAPPPGFSSQERYEHAYSPSPDNSFHGSLRPNQFELHSIRNAGDVEFIDPAILAVGKGIHPLELNNSGLGSASVIPPQFSSSEGKIKMQSSNIHDSYISSRFPEQINTNYSPFIHRQQLTTPNILNSQWSGWQNEQFGHDNFILINNEHKFML